MASVLVPQRQNKVERGSDNYSALLPIVAGAVGNAIVPGAGGAVGAAAGSYLAKEMATPDKVIGAQNTEAVQEAESAASRRLTKINADPYTAIAQANMALERAPKDVQEAYRKPLEEAMEIARKSRDNAARANQGGLG